MRQKECANSECNNTFETNKNKTKVTCSSRCSKKVYYDKNKKERNKYSNNYYKEAKNIILAKRKMKQNGTITTNNT